MNLSKGAIGKAKKDRRKTARRDGEKTAKPYQIGGKTFLVINCPGDLQEDSGETVKLDEPLPLDLWGE